MISLLARQFRASPWPTLLLAFTVAVLSLIVTAVPRLSSDLDDRQLAQRLSTLSAIQGDVAGAFTPPHLPERTAGPVAGDQGGCRQHP